MSNDANIIHVHGDQRAKHMTALIFDKQIECDDDTSDQDAELSESAALIATILYDTVPAEVYWRTLDHMNRLEAIRQGKTETQVTGLAAKWG
jgi:hypothetical protein